MAKRRTAEKLQAIENEPAAVWVSIAEIHPWEGNPRRNEEAIPKIAESIRRFGFSSPIVARKANGEIIAGHTRFAAAVKLGLERVPVRFLDVTEEDAHALALADNKLGEIAVWDEKALEEALAKLSKEDLDLTGFGTDKHVAAAIADADKANGAAPEKKPKPPAGGVPLEGTFEIVVGDVMHVLADYPDGYFDAVLSDPPYGLSFMGKTWDYELPPIGLWRQVLRVLRPGAPVIAFSATRTFHRFACSLEDAGFELRDTIAWLYSTGFPKSLDVSKALDEAQGAKRPVVGSVTKRDAGFHRTSGSGTPQPEHYQVREQEKTAPATDLAEAWDGYGTALKPAWEPAVLARKPLDGSVAANVMRHGVGGLAIDASRIGRAEDDTAHGWNVTGSKASENRAMSGGNYERAPNAAPGDTLPGRWPANVIFDAEAAAALDAQVGDLGQTSKPGSVFRGKPNESTSYLRGMESAGSAEIAYGDSGGPSRFFYVAKPGRRERELGLESFEAKARPVKLGSIQDGRAASGDDYARGDVKNVHPTVKPVALARHLARLILPPPGPRKRRLLVPFMGSGSEVIGALFAGWDHVDGIEREAEYAEIARARITYARTNPDDYTAIEDDDDGTEADESEEGP